jgi:predicted Ser/Thr protein kinase
MTSSPDQLFLEFQRALAGHYSLERELGRGGMGVVYLARDVALDRAVAIKLLPPIFAAQPTLRERFLREARTAARLGHPHIVPIHSVAERGGFVYFVMAYVPGRTLGQLVQEEGPLRPNVAARVLREIAWALGHAHAQGVVHRDVKPDNILIEESSGRALVSDFGIAQVAEQEGISGGHRAGTRGFMSPEQVAGEELDGRSDLYALGLVGIYAATGSVVGEGEDAQAVAAVAPAALRSPLAGCLETLPDDRFADAVEVAEAFAPQQVTAVETPAALRVWMTRSQPLQVAVSLWSLLFAFGTVMRLILMTVSDTDQSGLLGEIAVFLVAPWLVVGLARLQETRNVLAAGYSLADLRWVVTEEVARKREEYLYDSEKSSRLGALARRAAVSSVGAMVVIFVLQTAKVITLAPPMLARIGLGLGLTALIAGAAGLILPGRWVARDVPSDFGARFWKGKFGEWMAKLAGFGLGRRARPDDAVHRPTELLLADELEDLYASLPAHLKKGLEEVPGTIKRLAASAESLRAQVDAARALGQAVDREQEKMMEAVAALDTLRVGLLKLRAGTVSLEGFTTDLDAVRLIGDKVDRMADAHRALDRDLLLRGSNPG